MSFGKKCQWICSYCAMVSRNRLRLSLEPILRVTIRTWNDGQTQTRNRHGEQIKSEINAESSETERKSGERLTEAVIDEVVKGVAVAAVGELVVSGGELLEALRRHGGEVPGELRVLRQHHRSPRHEAVDQRLLPHRRNRKPRERKRGVLWCGERSLPREFELLLRKREPGDVLSEVECCFSCCWGKLRSCCDSPRSRSMRFSAERHVPYGRVKMLRVYVGKIRWRQRWMSCLS